MAEEERDNEDEELEDNEHDGDGDDDNGDDDGDYCNAENGVGQPAFAQISLQVLCELM